MTVFFNGQQYVTPAVVSAVDDSAMFNRNANVGNTLALVGRSSGGIPNSIMEFGNADEAKSALRSGDLLDAIVRAFDPSAETGAPATILAVRVNPASQATLTLKDSLAATVMTLVSTDYGLYTNQIKVKVEAATTKGLKLTTQLGDAYFSADNIYRDAFKVRYSGAQASARMSISTTTVTLEAPNSTAVATLDLNTYTTVQELVDRINAVTGFTASVLDGNGAKPALNGLDTVLNQDVKSADFTVPANLQAAVDWYNSIGEGFVTATRAANVGTVPAPVAFTYLSGGSDGTVTNTEWSDAFATLQTADAQWVVPLSNSASIHAMADAHVAYMSTVARKERRAICGTALGTTDAVAIAAAKALNSDRTSLVHLGGYDYNDAGKLTLYEPFIVAAMIAGGFAGVNPGTAMTNKSLKLRGLERKLRNPTDTDALIDGGVLCVEDTPTGFRVTKSISTWLTNDNYNRVEQSTGVALDYVARAVREALESVKGAKGSPQTLSLAVAKAETVLRELSVPEPNGLGVLVGDANNPAYKGLTGKLVGDVIAVEFQCSPVIPVNYVTITIHAVPYSGTASA